MPCLYGNMLLECAEFIAFQIFMLYSPSPPKILISSCQPPPSLSSVSHPSAIATFIFLSFSFFSFFTIASLSRSPSHPSYSQPVYTFSFWRLSHSSPSFNLGYFLHLSPLSFLSPGPSLSLSVPSFPSHCVHPFLSTLCPIHIKIFLPFSPPYSSF